MAVNVSVDTGPEFQIVDGVAVNRSAITHVRVTGSGSKSVEVYSGSLLLADLGPFPDGDPRIQSKFEAVLAGETPVTNAA